MKLIDSHCHLDHAAFDPDRQQVIKNARQLGVEHLVIPGTNRTSWPKILDLCTQFEGLHPALGIHPFFAEDYQPEEIDHLVEELRQQPQAAVGEIGLDFFDRSLDRKAQQQLLDYQLYIAAELKRPVILHVRKAHDEILKQLKAYDLVGGICHAFNGSWQQAKRYLDLGFYLGFGGMLTYERASKLRKLAQQVPLDAMVLETDAPDMSGAAHQYQRNSPEYLPEVVAVLAEIRGQEPEQIAAQTYQNTQQILGLQF